MSAKLLKINLNSFSITRILLTLKAIIYVKWKSTGICPNHRSRCNDNSLKGASKRRENDRRIFHLRRFEWNPFFEMLAGWLILWYQALEIFWFSEHLISFGLAHSRPFFRKGFVGECCGEGRGRCFLNELSTRDFFVVYHLRGLLQSSGLNETFPLQ